MIIILIDILVVIAILALLWKLFKDKRVRTTRIIFLEKEIERLHAKLDVQAEVMEMTQKRYVKRQREELERAQECIRKMDELDGPVEDVVAKATELVFDHVPPGISSAWERAINRVAGAGEAAPQVVQGVTVKPEVTTFETWGGAGG